MPLLLLGGLAIIDIIDQDQLAQARNAMMTQTSALRRDPARVGQSPPPMPITGSPDRLVIDGLRAARIAGMMPSGAERDALIMAAMDAAGRAAETRPNWGTAQIVLAYATSIRRTPDNTARARQALEKSYVDAPFSRDGGMWRIRFGATIWEDLRPATRNAVLREGVWLLGVEPQSWNAVFDSFRHSPAYMPFMLQWRTILSTAPHRLTVNQADQ